MEVVSLPKEGIFDQSLKGTKEQAGGATGGAARAKAMGQEQGQQPERLAGQCGRGMAR